MGNLTSRRTAPEPSDDDDDDDESFSSVPSQNSTGRASAGGVAARIMGATVPIPDERLLSTAAHVRTTRSQTKKPGISSSSALSGSDAGTAAEHHETIASSAKKKGKKRTKKAGTKRKASSTATAAASAAKKRKAVTPAGSGTKAKKRTRRVVTGRVCTWDENYAQLAAFKRENGHTRVPQSGDWKRLGDWVKFQFRRKEGPYNNCGKLDQERIDKLDMLGVDWIVNDTQYWGTAYAQLQAFFKENGHCNIPSRGKANKQLSQWVHDQKSRQHGAYKGWRQLNKAEIERLESVGVQFD